MRPLAGRDILTVRDFTRDELTAPFALTDEYRARVADHEPLDLLRGHVLCSLFYEPSTRTRLSFESAMQRLGGGVLSVPEAMRTSSAAKGESLADAVRVTALYADVLVLRHPERGAADVAADATEVPVLSAGDGAGEHPVQAFSELYTIHRERGGIDGQEITFLGDLAHARVMRSLAIGLSRFDVRVNFVAPRGLEMDADIVAELPADRVRQTESLDEVIGSTDVLYLARIQAERYPRPEAVEAFKASYRVDPSIFERAPEGLTVMHPLPRLDELDPAVDANPGAAYFRQAEDLLYNRMALLALLLGAR